MAIVADSETIVAVATPAGRGALALLRLSGPGVFIVTAKCLQGKVSFEKVAPRTVGLYTAINPASRKILDQVTIIKYGAPRSYTGENMVEIICHGGVLVTGELLDALKSAGARVATGGEFTRRALINGKIDILKAEAIQAIIESESRSALAGAWKIYRGGAFAVLDGWRRELMEILASIEAWIEFDDDAIMHGSEGRKKIGELAALLEADLDKRKRIKVLEKGVKIVIGGPANAGKSTLFNRLLGCHRAIVHAEPGTTRDLVGENVQIGEHEVRLVDSAGIRVAEDAVEAEGIERSRLAIRGASILLWVSAADEEIGEEELELLEERRGEPLLCVINKTDRGDPGEKKVAFEGVGAENIIAISLKQDDRIATIEKELKGLVDRMQEGGVPDFIVNRRHEEVASRLIERIRSAREFWDRPEIAALHIKDAISCFEEYFGETDSEELMNTVFEKFCIGK
jgi:tRNA modification GTPase